ncbi:MAG: FKBP-type peptidyl-prolyl cis-trans isomerase [Paludibacteraceae bacterium]|nr:FKBP-type peptidyl-prolyl cis-trans isomerase [Paludibacteraceae bacterium]
MKQLKYIIVILLLLTASGCTKHFMTWKDYNNEWLKEFAENDFGKDPEIVRTTILPSGILVEVYHDGYGAYPKRTNDPVRGTSSEVNLTLEGYLVDGTNFLLKGTTSYYVSDLIGGLQEVLCSMRQGSHWKVYLPYSEAYGSKGTEGSLTNGNFNVPPYSVLIFDIDLLDVTNY